MTFVALGAALALAWFVAIDAFFASLVIAVSRLRARRGATAAPSVLAVLRLAPAATAMLFVLAWFVPAYWQFEPREAGERLGVTLTLAAALGAAVVAVTIWTTSITAFRTRRVARRLTERATPVADAGCSVPVLANADESTCVALVGIARPKLFLGGRVRETLTDEELSAVVAHEMAHHSARDNWIRLAFAGCRDVLALTGAGRTLERQWRAAAEQAADGRAWRHDSRRALHLASALVKVARVMPAGSRTGAVFSSLHDCEDGALLPARVQRLLAHEPPPSSRAGLVAGSAVAAICLFATTPAARAIVHDATELLVRLLP